MQVIKVLGLASKRMTTLEVQDEDMDKNLLLWLRSRGVTIASSCDGEGVCRKCVIQEGLLSCEFTLGEFFAKFPRAVVEVAYL